ncbi:hypothetical protein KI387_033351, partial [Taxus chinensis]
TLPRDKVVQGHTSDRSIIGGAGTSSVDGHLPLSWVAWATPVTSCTVETMKIMFELLVYPRTTRDVNLHELFKLFGHITEDAQRAIDKLIADIYDNLILIVEWATPSSGFVVALIQGTLFDDYTFNRPLL